MDTVDLNQREVNYNLNVMLSNTPLLQGFIHNLTKKTQITRKGLPPIRYISDMVGNETSSCIIRVKKQTYAQFQSNSSKGILIYDEHLYNENAPSLLTQQQIQTIVAKTKVDLDEISAFRQLDISESIRSQFIAVQLEDKQDSRDKSYAFYRPLCPYITSKDPDSYLIFFKGIVEFLLTANFEHCRHVQIPIRSNDQIDDYFIANIILSAIAYYIELTDRFKSIVYTNDINRITFVVKDIDSYFQTEMEYLFKRYANKTLPQLRTSHLNNLIINDLTIKESDPSLQLFTSLQEYLTLQTEHDANQRQRFYNISQFLCFIEQCYKHKRPLLEIQFNQIQQCPFVNQNVKQALAKQIIQEPE